MTRSDKEECVSGLVPSPRLVRSAPLRSRGGRRRVRPEETLLPPEGPSHLLRVYPGSPPAPQRPGAGCAGPGAGWSEHRRGAGRPGRTARKSGEEISEFLLTVGHLRSFYSLIKL